LFGELDPTISAAIFVDIHALLELHDGYNVVDLFQFLKTNHPLIPAKTCLEVVIAATSVAWYVSKMQFVREQYLHSPIHQELAENVGTSMLSCFSGLKPA